DSFLRRIRTLFLIYFALSGGSAWAQETPADTVPRYPFPIPGTVFLDRNANGIKDHTEPGMEGVAVSDGYDVVLSDASGTYLLPIRGKNAAFVLVHQRDSVKQSGKTLRHILNRKKDAGERFASGLQPAGAQARRNGVRFVQLRDSHIRNPSDRAYMKTA